MKIRKSVLQEILNVSLYLLIVLLLTLAVVKFVGERTKVNGSSMEPTLSEGENLIINKAGYHFKQPERFDIVVFSFKYAKHTYYIKRIIGLPGDTVRIDDQGTIYINGEVLNESYGAEVICDPGIASNEITLGKDEYFVLGDNRNRSVDSRDPSVGVVHKSQFVGTVWIRILPLNKFGRVTN